MGGLQDLGAASLGVWTRVEARQHLTAGQIDELVRLGVWQVLWRGVYADGGYVVTAEQRAIAAVLAVGGSCAPGPAPPRAAAIGRTAARVWGFPLIDDDDPVTRAREQLLDDVAVTRSLPRQRFDGRTLRPRLLRLSTSDVVQQPSGLWVSRPLRTIADCARWLSHEALVCVLDAALHRGAASSGSLQQLVTARQGQAGGPALARAVPLADGRAEAPTETLARLLLLPVLPRLEPQVRLFDHRGRVIARFDLGDREARLGIETDGIRGHSGDAMVAKDRRRDRTSERRGWTTERLRWWELRREQDDVVRRMVWRHGQLMARLDRAA